MNKYETDHYLAWIFKKYPGLHPATNIGWGSPIHEEYYSAMKYEQMNQKQEIKIGGNK